MKNVGSLFSGTASALLFAATISPPQAVLAAQAQPDQGAPATDQARCYGTVTDAAGNPLAGATVEYWQREASLRQYQGTGLKLKENASTGSDGAFAFQTSRTVGLLLVRKPGLALTWRQLDQRFRPARDEKQALIVTPAANLSGVVVDDSDRPIAGATVFVTAAFTELPNASGRTIYNYLTGKPARESFPSLTDATGRFAIQNFPTNASAALIAQSSGKALRPTEQGPGNMMFRGYRSGDEIKLVMEPAARIEGRVLADDKAGPPNGARLVLRLDHPGFFGDLGQPEPIEAAADGSVVIDGVAAGAYHLSALFDNKGVPDWVAENVPVNVKSGQIVGNLRVLAQGGAVLEVSVRTKAGHRPLANVAVSAAKTGFRAGAGSDANGLACLRLIPGDYKVSAFRDAGQEQPISVTLEAGQTNKIELDLESP